MALNKGYLTAKTDKASDEVYTPSYAVIPIIKYLKALEFKTIWCPFDTEESEFVRILRENGYNVIATHIDNGQNFFEYEPDDYDCIVSNPPFSIKDLILKRLYELNKPYAMLLPLPSLQGQKRFPYIKDCEALVFDKRINYFKNLKTKEIQKRNVFASIYVCRNILPEKLIIEELNLQN